MTFVKFYSIKKLSK